jgi:MFS family permease
LPAGWLAERLNARKVLAAGLAIWGVATALTGLANSFLTLLALRVMLGVGESVMYPASFKILATEASEGQRGRANGVFAAGQLCGPAVGTLGGGLLMAWLGWRLVFIIFGCASLLWLWPWLRTRRTPATSTSQDAHSEPSVALILTRRELWGSCLGTFCEGYVLYLVLSWLPLYLVEARGFSVPAMAQIAAGVYALSALSATVSGSICDRWLASGASCNRVRKTALIVGMAGLALCIGACANAGPVASLLAMAGCGVSLGVVTPAIFSSTQTLAGAGAAARWMGIQNFFCNLAGIVGPVITGALVDRTGGFSVAFSVAAVLALVGLIAYGVIVPRIEPIEWTAVARRLPGIGASKTVRSRTAEGLDR